MTAFRFIHTADVHLDSPLRGLSGHEGGVAQRIRSASRDAFDQFVTQALEEEVSFIVIAGDLYDGDWPDYNTGLHFVRQMGRLSDAGIAAFILHGNHDAESQLTRHLSLPPTTAVFPARRPATFRLPQLDVVLHGQSYRERAVTDNLITAYPEPVSGAFNIGVHHTGLGGTTGHANYAPCTLNELVAKGYDYWALGHVHQPAVLREQNGHPLVVFSGNLQGRDISEAGPRSACLVTVEDRQIVDFALLPTDLVRWARVAVPLGEEDTLSVVPDRIREAIRRTVAGGLEGRLLACRVELTGRTAAHDRLLADQAWVLAEARAASLALGDEVAWVERVVVATRSPVDPAAQRAREDALGDLYRVLAQAPQDAQLVAQLEGDIGELVRRLPLEIRNSADDAALGASLEGDWAGLMAQVQSYLAARLATAKE